MNARALTLAIRLLSTAAAGAVLGTMPGCFYLFGCGDTGWQPQESLALGVDADLEALVYTDTGYLAVGTGGTVVTWDYSGSTQSTSVGAVDLHAVASFQGVWWVAGDGGQVFSSSDSGQTWTPAEIGGTTANLWAIGSDYGAPVMVGDDVVLVLDPSGTWVEVTPPDTGWGELRGVFSDGVRTYAVGRAGVVWSTEDPTGTWTAEDVAIDADLFDGGTIFSDADGGQVVVVVGAAGTLAIRDSNGTWTTVDTGLGADLLDMSGTSVISADGVVYEIDAEGGLTEVGTFTGMRALLTQGSSSSILTVGDGGVSKSMEYFECIGGRPFTIEGQLQTASLQPSDAWCPAEPSPTQLPKALADRLAAEWAQDGLYEHASVASFARFMLELLALGAPPTLLHEAQAAIQDELRHAELCFALARRFGGAPVGPGSLAIPEHALARAGDPVATALALFEEGCVNESVAACEAADALEACVDAEVRDTLEIIAADERRHATAAWAALRWLLDSYGELVREPLRRRVAELAVAPSRVGAVRSTDELEAGLAAHGRSSLARRAAVQRRVLVELVLPLAHGLVASPTEQPTASRL